MESILPNLHQMYRLLPESEMPASDEDKSKCLFIWHQKWLNKT